MPVIDRPLPYSFLVPLAELDHVIHGDHGVPKTLEVDVVFTPTKDFPEPHRDMPAKGIIQVMKRDHRLVVKLLDVVLTPEQAEEKAEHDAWKAERAAENAKREAATVPDGAVVVDR